LRRRDRKCDIAVDKAENIRSSFLNYVPRVRMAYSMSIFNFMHWAVLAGVVKVA
jgi:hypothetical protein